MKFNKQSHPEEIKLEMTSMIDIVFQLLIFFVFTFKVILPEGDFNIHMPSSAASQVSEPSETPLIRVRIRSTPSGELAGLMLNDKSYTGEKLFLQLHNDIRAMVADTGGPGTSDLEVEIEADYDLDYRYTIDVTSAITGWIDPNTKEQHKLVERVRFSPLDDE